MIHLDMRQLAAIMFSDMAGYTALMQTNEQLATKKRHKMKAVLEENVTRFHGKILQYYGDGALTIFNSVIDCIHCAISVQQALRTEPQVDVRIGIHSGDVSVEQESIYGDGVNVASRIESLALPGSIFISEKVFTEIQNQEHLHVREMGYFDFKNIVEPVRIYAIDEAGIMVPRREALRGKIKQPTNRLAILPFRNMSADPENEYFSDGITEELLNAITKVKGLQVTSRTSAFAFKDRTTDIREIGIQLNVDRILEGSVRRSGNRVRITAQLINTADGYHIWSENYDRNLTDIFEVQDEISGIIANRLRENFNSKEQEERLVKVPTRNMEVYTLFLKGMHFHNKITPADERKAIECLEQAIKIEPDYAQAYAMAAAGYAFLGGTGQMIPAEAFEIVHRYSDKAIALDHTVSIGYSAKGAAYLFYDWKWKEAFEVLTKAIQLSPATTGAHQLLCFYYMMTGGKTEAVDVMEKALVVDPLSPIINHYLAEAYSAAGRTEDALRQVEALLDIHPRMSVALELKGWCVGILGDWKKAVEIFSEVKRLTQHPLKGVTPLACAYAQLGETDKVHEYIAMIHQRQAEEPGVVLDADLAMIWWGLRDRDKAFHYLFRCVENRMGAVAMMINHPLFSELKDDPRCKKIKMMMNLATE